MSTGGLEVFALEDTAVQVCWSSLEPGTTIRVGDASFEITDGGVPGAAALEGLQPATAYAVELRRPGRGSRARRLGAVRTLAPPPGERLCRFATVNDLHIGEARFGALWPRNDPAPHGSVDTYALRCATAACEEAVAWGAEALFVKGDLTYSGRLLQWDALARLLASVRVPVSAVLGNHDVGTKAVDGRSALARHGIVVPLDPYAIDMAGIRVVMAHTAVHGAGHGSIPAVDRELVAALVREAARPSFVAMHHYPQRFERALMYPPGIPASQARPFLDAVVGANPASIVAVGHSHRHRRHTHGPLIVTEIGATMHYPGTWAGYAVHEGGIRQVVRRVAAPAAIAWTEATKSSLGGLWGLWSPGRRDHRCFSHTWPR